MPERGIGRHRRRPRADRLRALLPYVGMLALIGLILGLGSSLGTDNHHAPAPGGSSGPDAAMPSTAPKQGAAGRATATGTPLHVPGAVGAANPLGMLAPAEQTAPPSSSARPAPSAAPSSTIRPPESTSTLPAPPSAGERIIAQARTYVGVAYVRGGASPTGFDNSGYTMWVYARASVANLPHDAEGQRRAVGEISIDEARPGDLVFHLSRGHADEVAIYAGDGQQYAAEVGRSVRLEPVWSSHIRFGTDWH